MLRVGHSRTGSDGLQTTPLSASRWGPACCKAVTSLHACALHATTLSAARQAVRPWACDRACQNLRHSTIKGHLVQCNHLFCLQLMRCEMLGLQPVCLRALQNHATASDP